MRRSLLCLHFKLMMVIVNTDEALITYSNVVSTGGVSEVLQGTGIQAIRSAGTQMTLECRYDSHGQVSSSFATQGEDLKKVAGTNDVIYELKLYTDQTYSTAYK